MAAMTDAEYYLAESADELLDVFATVPAHLATTDVETEVTAISAALAALLACRRGAFAVLEPLPLRPPSVTGALIA